MKKVLLIVLSCLFLSGTSYGVQFEQNVFLDSRVEEGEQTSEISESFEIMQDRYGEVVLINAFCSCHRVTDTKYSLFIRYDRGLFDSLSACMIAARQYQICNGGPYY